MRLSIGLLQVTVPYTYQRGKTIIFQRAVPTDLRDRYPSKTIKLDLKTSDWQVAARKATKLLAAYEAEWSGLRAAPNSSPKTLKVHASALLREFGLVPGCPNNHPTAVDLFIERLEEKLSLHANGCEETYREADPSDFLPPVELEALRLLKGQNQPTIGEALELHLSIHKKQDDEKFTTYQRRAFATLLEVTGDKPIESFTRDDARAYIAKALEDGNSTGTVRRRLGVFQAVFTTWRLEKDKQLANPFEKLSIANEGTRCAKPARSACM